jgi:predicted nuclease of predicted toxin-antitoxin system
MRFLIDEQLSRRLVTWFEQRSYEAEHVEVALGLAATDEAIVAYAKSRNTVIISKDMDFLDLVNEQDGPQLVWVRVGNSTTPALTVRLATVWPEIEQALRAGQRVVEVE